MAKVITLGNLQEFLTKADLRYVKGVYKHTIRIPNADTQGEDEINFVVYTGSLTALTWSGLKSIIGNGNFYVCGIYTNNTNDFNAPIVNLSLYNNNTELRVRYQNGASLDYETFDVVDFYDSVVQL